MIHATQLAGRPRTAVMASDARYVRNPSSSTAAQKIRRLYNDRCWRICRLRLRFLRPVLTFRGEARTYRGNLERSRWSSPRRRTDRILPVLKRC